MKYRLFFHVYNSNDGDWGDAINRADQEADSPWEAFIKAFQTAYNDGIGPPGEGLPPNRWSFERAYWELTENENWSWHCVCLDEAGADCEVNTPSYRIRLLQHQIAEIEESIKHLKAILAPIGVEDLMIPDVRAASSHLTFLRGYYESKISQIEQTTHSIETYSDTLANKGREEFETYRAACNAAFTAHKPPLKK